MSASGNDTLLGRLALHKRMLTLDQLREATGEQGRFGNEGQRLGEILVAKGFVSPAQLDELLALQRAFVAELAAKGPATPPGAPPATPAAPAPTTPAAAEWGPPPEDPFKARAHSAGGSDLDLAAPPSRGIDLELEEEPASGALELDGPTAPAPSFSLDTGFELATGEEPALELDAPVAPAPAPAPAPIPAAPAPAAPAPAAPAPAAPAPAPATERSSFTLAEKGASLAARAERLDKVLSDAARMGASDIHLHPGSPLKVRVNGHLHNVGEGLLEAKDTETLLREALNPAQRELLEKHGQIDLAYPVPGIGRFRANFYRGHTGMNGVLRFVPGFVPSLMQLGLPTELGRLTTFHQGLVLVTGPAGCGKSTTLASLVNILNEERTDHILTIEDPVEYIHNSKRSLVNQREVSRHTESFARALRAALREDPDVIVIGELRDLETISLALTAAETGHLVLGTLHTNSAIRTINRIIGAFPPGEQSQIRSMISESLRAIISQRLVPRADNRGRSVALEVLRVNKAVANTIRENRAFQLRSTMQTGRSQGMLLLDQSLQELVKSGVVTKEEALRHVEDPRFLS